MSAPPVQYATTEDGLRIAYTVSGAGPPLLRGPIGFNHVQALWSLSGWQQLAAAIESRFRLITFDHRGQGMSTRGLTGAPTAADYQRDIEAIVAKVDPAPLVMFAFTGLAHVALRYASLNPDRVRALVTWNATLERQPTPTMEFGRGSADNWQAFLFALSSAMPLEDAFQVKEAFEQSMTFEDFVNQNEALRNFSLEDIAWPIDVPTLILGSRSGSRAARFEADGKQLASLIPHSLLLLFDDATGGLDASHGQAAPALAAIERFVAELPAHDGPPPDGVLSARELDVLRLIAKGRSNRQIADELTISLNTVQHHVSNILAKKELSNRTELAAYAHSHNLV